MYLINTRNIDKKIVYEFVKKDKIYANKHGNCVFIGYDIEGQPKYGSLRLTNSSGKFFRCDVKNSNRTYPFCMSVTNDTVYAFEAHNIRGFESHCISLGGVADKALKYYLKKVLT